MTDVSFALDRDLAGEIGQRAAEAGQTASAWIASRLPEWLEGDKLANELEAALASLRQTLAEATSQ